MSSSHPQYPVSARRDVAAGKKFREGVLALERVLAPYAGPNLIGDPYRDDARVARELGGLHRIVVRAVIVDRTVAEWVVTAGSDRYTILAPSARPSQAALRAARYRVVFPWTDFALVSRYLRGTYGADTTTELPRRFGEVVAMPYESQRGVILSGDATFKFNRVDARASAVRLGQRVSFVPRIIGQTAVATDLRVKPSAGWVEAA